MRHPLPASKSGGAVLLVGGAGDSLGKVTLAGREMKFQSVWSDKAYWQCPWRAWQSEVGPGDKARELRVVLGKGAPGQPLPVTVYFIPKDR